MSQSMFCSIYYEKTNKLWGNICYRSNIRRSGSSFYDRGKSGLGAAFMGLGGMFMLIGGKNKDKWPKK